MNNRNHFVTACISLTSQALSLLKRDLFMLAAAYMQKLQHLRQRPLAAANLLSLFNSPLAQ